MAINKYPTRFSTLYNYIFFQSTSNNVVIERLYDSNSHKLIGNNTDNMKTYEISRILQIPYDKTKNTSYSLSWSDKNTYNNFYIDTDLVTLYRYRINGASVGVWYYAYNAIYKYSNPFTDGTLTKKFLTNFTHNKIYQGYPYTLSIFNGENDLVNNPAANVYLQYDDGDIDLLYSISNMWINNNPTSVQQLYHITFNVTSSGNYFTKDPSQISEIPIVNDDGDGGTTNITTNDGQTNIILVRGSNLIGIDNIVLEQGCVDENDSNVLYVRWINDIAGWEYYMFRRVLTINHTKSDNERFDYVNNIERYNYQYGGINEQTFYVGDESLSDEDLYALSMLPQSNNIAYFDTNYQKWIHLTCKEQTITRGYKNHTFECTLVTDNDKSKQV